ncbi:hypothetical protein AB1N83_013870 [Pleurotus pulmonarius]
MMRSVILASISSATATIIDLTINKTSVASCYRVRLVRAPAISITLLPLTSLVRCQELTTPSAPPSSNESEEFPRVYSRTAITWRKRGLPRDSVCAAQFNCGVLDSRRRVSLKLSMSLDAVYSKDFFEGPLRSTYEVRCPWSLRLLVDQSRPLWMDDEMEVLMEVQYISITPTQHRPQAVYHSDCTASHRSRYETMKNILYIWIN